MIIFEQKNTRVSLITSRLIRVESGSFTDLPTQTVMNRSFENLEYNIEDLGDEIIVTTSDAVFSVDIPFANVNYIKIGDSNVKDFKNSRLSGTARTLDTANGAVKLENGITSLSGASVMDDSNSLLINPDGSMSTRPKCSD